MSHRIPLSLSGGRRLTMTVAGVLLAFFAATASVAPADPLGLAPDASPEAQAEPIQVGAEAPDFSLESIDGQASRLSDLRGEKSAVIIFFRGSW